MPATPPRWPSTTWPRSGGPPVCATIDPEDFYDFTVTRPMVRSIPGEERRIEWPQVELLAADVPSAGHDMLLLRGVEPQLRWRSFCQAVVSIVKAMGAELVVVLGALLADVPHTRPVRVSGTTTDRELAQPGRPGRADLRGPDRDRRRARRRPAGRPGSRRRRSGRRCRTTCISCPRPRPPWRSSSVRPPCSGAPFDPLALRTAAAEYERQVSERVADDEDAAAYVAQLEDAEDLEAGQTDGPGLTPAGAEPVRCLRAAPTSWPPRWSASSATTVERARPYRQWRAEPPAAGRGRRCGAPAPR